VFIAFYAPWCPHCQTFVMHDGKGNATNAPLEVFNRQLMEAKGPKVVKFDTQASQVPKLFKVEYIPTVYLALKDGTATKFTGNPHDMDALKAFAMQEEKKSGAAALAAAPASFAAAAGAQQADVPAWACAIPAPGAAAADVMLHAQAAEAVAGKGAQQVAAVNAASLPPLVQKATEDIFIAFYAPWCPHCQTFVMHDANGNATNAPLEVFNRQLIEAKGPKVVKFDTQASMPPGAFKVKYIPTIYMAFKDGTVKRFSGNPHDLVALKAFAMPAGASSFAAHTVAAVAGPAAAPAAGKKPLKNPSLRQSALATSKL